LEFSPDWQKVENLVNIFSEGDMDKRAGARKELRLMGKNALPFLEMLRFGQEGKAFTEVYQVMIDIGDDIFAREGIEGLSEDFIKAIQFGAKKIRQHAPEEVHTLSAAALARWGLEVPPVLEQKVLTCHVCGRKSTELRVGLCFLHTCNNAVCKQHAFVIETRFGLLNGTGGAWFCSQEHQHYANHNFSVWL